MTRKQGHIALIIIFILSAFSAIGLFYALAYFLVQLIGVRGLVSLILATMAVVLMVAAMIDDRKR